MKIQTLYLNIKNPSLSSELIVLIFPTMKPTYEVKFLTFLLGKRQVKFEDH